MSYQLINDRQMKLMNNRSWTWLVELAVRNGWQPSGAEAPDGPSALEGYFPFNEFKLVSRDDARAFGAALRAALESGKDFTEEPDDRVPEAITAKMREVFAERDMRVFVKEIADFADEGAFEIW